MILSLLYLKLLQCDASIINPTWYLSAAICFALLPIAVGLLTSYVKINIVLGIIKNALGTQHAPSAMVTLALSLALTALSMRPVIKETTLLASNIDIQQVSKFSTSELINKLKPVIVPWESFLRKNCGTREVAALQDSGEKLSKEDIDLTLLIPAFLLSELKEGFAMAFIVLLPFLAIDLIISNILMGLGMMMVSPVLISLPIKLLLFVISDSWLLIAQALIHSYQV